MELVAVILTYLYLILEELLPLQGHLKHLYIVKAYLSLYNVSDGKVRVCIFTYKSLFYLWVLKIPVFPVVPQFETVLNLRSDPGPYRFNIEVQIILNLPFLDVNGVKGISGKNDIVLFLISSLS
jgi:hypothetical protein